MDLTPEPFTPTEIKLINTKTEKQMSNRTADSLYGALMLDIPATPAAAVDFGLDGSNEEQNRLKYSYLQLLVREGQITEDDLAEVACNGPALTKLVRSKFKQPLKLRIMSWLRLVPVANQIPTYSTCYELLN
jgi:hypothetical protein